MDTQSPGKRHIHQGLGIVDVTSSCFNQTPGNLECQISRELEPFRPKTPASCIDIDRSSSENKDIPHSGVINEGGQRT